MLNTPEFFRKKTCTEFFVKNKTPKHEICDNAIAFNFEITASYLEIRKLAYFSSLASVIQDVIFNKFPTSMNLNRSQIYNTFVKKV